MTVNKKPFDKTQGKQETRNKEPQIDISYVAKLANLTLSTNEKKKFSTQLEEILDYIKQLSKVNTNKIEPISQITGLENVTREDVAAPSLTQEEALANAPRGHNGFFEVDAVLGEGNKYE